MIGPFHPATRTFDKTLIAKDSGQTKLSVYVEYLRPPRPDEEDRPVVVKAILKDFDVVVAPNP